MVTIFRELRERRHRGRQDQAQDAERHAVDGRGDLRRQQRPGHGRATSATACMRAADLAAGLTGAVVKDPVQDRVVWHEYLRNGRQGARRLEGSLSRLPGGPVSDTSRLTHARLRHPPPRPGLRAQPAAPRWSLAPGHRAGRGAARRRGGAAARRHDRDEAAGGAAGLSPRRRLRARSSIPFAEFSPEWQALRYALARGIPVRFMDLPQCHRLADRQPATERTARG